MVIYEVNLEVDAEIEAEFQSWLTDHVERILEIDGFDSADVFRRAPADENGAPGVVLWTCHYRLKNRAKLDEYFRNHAARMRQEGADKFGGRFKANRRILTLERTAVR